MGRSRYAGPRPIIGGGSVSYAPWAAAVFSNGYRGCSASSQLKTASVRVTSTNVTDAYGGQATRSTRVNGNAWRGDSGGPQFYNGQQVGVASTADGQNIQNYGSVAYNRAWITSVAGV
nr:trypsin-like serine protease [Micromonospora sp. RTGN7]